MTPAQLARFVRYPGFPASARRLVTVAGLDAAARLISAWPGQEWPVPSVEGSGTATGVKRWAQLVEIVGEDAARRIICHYRGDRLYIPRCDVAATLAGRESVRADYARLTSRAGGASHGEAVYALGLKYGRTGRWIERIVNRPAEEAAPAPPAPHAELF
jgi:hypothetical protein